MLLKPLGTLNGIRWCDSTPQSSLRLASSPFWGAMCRYLASPEKGRETASGGGGVLLLSQACGLPAPLSGEPCVGILSPLKKGGEPPAAVEGLFT